MYFLKSLHMIVKELNGETVRITGNIDGTLNILERSKELTPEEMINTGLPKVLPKNGEKWEKRNFVEWDEFYVDWQKIHRENWNVIIDKYGNGNPNLKL